MVLICRICTFAAANDRKVYMIKIYINDETSPLKAVVLGTSRGLGAPPSLEEAYDPKSKQHLKAGTYPREQDIAAEMEGFRKVLEKHGVQVYRPEIISNYNQIFSRDIAFVIENKFIRPRILKYRKEEIRGIQYILDQIPKDQLLEVPEDVRIEGGDVIPWKDHIFVGYSEPEDFNKYTVSRTNVEGVNFLKENFPAKKVKAFELKKSDEDPYENALHLDCCFQPIGKDKAIIYKGGFKKESDYQYLVDYFGKDNLFEITKEEMYEMFSNVFSITQQVIVSDERFNRLNKKLREWGFTVEEIPYGETAKMEGLLRCSTLPLLRET